MKRITFQLYERLGDFYAHSKVCSSNLILLVWCLGLCAPLLFVDLIAPIILMSCLLVSALCLVFCYLKRLEFSFALIVLVFFAGLYWSSSTFKAHRDRQISPEFELQNVIIEGTVEGLPVNRKGDVSFVFKVRRSVDNALRKNVLIKLSCYRCPWDIKPSENWRFTVRLKQPHGYASWGAFDYEKYLFRKQIVAKGYIRNKDENSLIGFDGLTVNQTRWKIRNRLDELDHSDSVGFAMIQALTIGDKSSLTAEQREVFQKSGISHLMAISGLHVGLVFLITSVLFRWLTYPIAQVYQWMPRQHLVLIPALLSAFFYSALAGFAISTQRAFIMLSVYVLCRFIARDVGLRKVLLIAMSVILLLDPFSILDVGFWLSCGAVFVIAQLNLESKKLSLLKLQPKLWLWMLPMTALFFGQVSFISPLVNLVAVPVFCVVLIPATLAAVSLLVLPFDQPFVLMLEALDKTYQLIYQWLFVLSNTSIASWYTLEWSWVQTALLCVLLLAYYVKFNWRYAAWLGLIFSVFIPVDDLINRSFGRNELSVALLDVGQGLSMVIHVEPENYTLVYDTGPRYSSGFSVAEAVLLPFLRGRGVNQIDRLIISHGDNDHIGGYQALVDAMPVGDVLTSRVDMLPDAAPCKKGQRWMVGAVTFQILSPDKATPKGSNNLSCVLKVELGQTSVLITGDIEKQVERYLLQQGDGESAKLDADIMLVPHQGSKTSSTFPFIDQVEPELALVAAGYLNHYGHPHPNVVQRYQDRGVDFVSTVDNGSVIINVNQQSWRRQSFRDVERGFWHHQKKPNWD